MEALRILNDTEDDNGNAIVKSAIFREDHPGRIYIELKPGPPSLEQKNKAREDRKSVV